MIVHAGGVWSTFGGFAAVVWPSRGRRHIDPMVDFETIVGPLALMVEV